MTWEEICALGRELPEVTEGVWFRTPALLVRGKSFVRLKEDGSPRAAQRAAQGRMPRASRGGVAQARAQAVDRQAGRGKLGDQLRGPPILDVEPLLSAEIAER
jgi:hypothetical protein